MDVAFGGTTYPVLVYVPKSLDRKGRVPLVLNLHGSSANGAIQMDISGLRAVAEDEGFIVAAPNGAIPLPRDPLPAGGSWAWNVPGVPTTAGQFPPPDARGRHPVPQPHDRRAIGATVRIGPETTHSKDPSLAASTQAIITQWPVRSRMTRPL